MGLTAKKVEKHYTNNDEYDKYILIGQSSNDEIDIGYDEVTLTASDFFNDTSHIGDFTAIKQGKLIVITRLTLINIAVTAGNNTTLRSIIKTAYIPKATLRAVYDTGSTSPLDKVTINTNGSITTYRNSNNSNVTTSQTIYIFNTTYEVA